MAKVLLKNNHVPKTRWGLDIHATNGDGTGRNESSLTRTNGPIITYLLFHAQGKPVLPFSLDQKIAVIGQASMSKLQHSIDLGLLGRS